MGLLLTYILLNSWQQVYIYYILCLSDSILTKNILSIIFQINDKNTQPKELPEYDLIQLTNQRIRIYKQYFAKQVLVSFNIYSAERVELILAMPVQPFFKKIYIEKKSKAIEIAKKLKTGPISVIGVTNLS